MLVIIGIKARLLLLIVFSIQVSTLYAEEEEIPLPVENKNENTSQSENALLKWGQNLVDEQQEFISKTVVGFSERIDNYFSDDRKTEESSKTRIRFAVSSFSFREKDSVVVTDVDARVHLPKTEGKLRLEFYSGDSNGDQTDVTRGQKTLNDSVDNNGFNLGIGYFLKAKKLLNVRLRSGINFRSNKINPFIDLRARNTIDFLSTWKMHLTETLFWENVIGAGLKTSLDFEHPVTENIHFRSASNATYYKTGDYLALSQDFLLFQSIDDRSALIYQTGAIGDDLSGNARVDTYYSSIRYRQRIYKDWMFMELMPQIRYPRDDNFKQETSIMVQFSMLFGARQ
jgi:hypothetical protein